MHRHRLAPSVARQIAVASRARDLVVRAGEVLELNLVRDGVEAAWRPRGDRAVRRLKVAAVVNCTGFAGDLDRASDPLLSRLLAQGLIRPDPHQLGLDVDDAARPLSEAGTPTRGLFAVGPLTRGAVWEMTSVPDIRIQAAQAAASILAELPRRAAA